MILDAFRALAAALGEPPVPWYVFGAQAVVIHGIPRLTADIDVAIDASTTTPERVLERLDREGIGARSEVLRAAMASARLWPLVHAASSTPIDAILVDSDIDLGFLARVKRVDIGGCVLPFLSAEDLIATKLVAGRRKDREDVRGILDSLGDALDVALLERVLDDLDRALDEPRVVRRFAVLRRSMRARKR